MKYDFDTFQCGDIVYMKMGSDTIVKGRIWRVNISVVDGQIDNDSSFICLEHMWGGKMYNEFIFNELEGYCYPNIEDFEDYKHYTIE